MTRRKRTASRHKYAPSMEAWFAAADGTTTWIKFWGGPEAAGEAFAALKDSLLSWACGCVLDPYEFDGWENAPDHRMADCFAQRGAGRSRGTEA